MQQDIAPATDGLGPHQKALQINLESTEYGTFAEIGAGQEVARWFFRVGGASGTIAKTISAYDMTVSDAIYGRSDRYVSRHRLMTMLDYEFHLLQERLNEKRGDRTKFFVFADTVAAKSYTRNEEGQGWMGIRFQTAPQVEPSEIIIHVRLLDNENMLQQEALGLVGVNLIYGAFHLHPDPPLLIHSLLDNLTRNRVEIDMIKFSGPAFPGLDNRLMSLQLVQQGLTSAAMFTANGEVVQAAEVLYKKCVLVERGSFRPVTHVTLDMLEQAQQLFLQEPETQADETVFLMEMTLKNLTDAGCIDHRDFLDRVDLLAALGKTVLISNYGEYYRLASYLFRYTKRKIGIVMGIPSLKEVFDEKYYANLEGGILESFGRLFKNDLRLYIYPFKDPANGRMMSVDDLEVSPNLRHLYSYLRENRHIRNLPYSNFNHLKIFSRDVLKKIQSGDATWKEMVPAQVAQLIEERHLFGCK